MENFRKSTAESLRALPKNERKGRLVALQRSDEYWTARVEKLKIGGQKAEFSQDRTSLKWKVKSVYHGSDVEGIQEFNFAEESSIGDNAVYFAIDPTLAMEYSRLRPSERNTGKSFLYEAILSDVNLMNWAETNIVEKLKIEYAEYCKKILSEIDANGYDAVTKIYAIPATLNERVALTALKRIITICAQEGALNGGNVKNVAFGALGIFFERFVESKGFDGVITIEGGDSENLTSRGGVSVVIYNKNKIQSHRQIEITKPASIQT